jgi:hypothetical protein
MFSLSRIVMSGLLVMVLCLSALVDSTVWLPWLLGVFLLILVRVHTSVFLSNFTPVSLHMLKCSCAHTLSCLFSYCSFASIGHADIMCSVVSSNCWQSLHLLYVSVFNIFLHNILFVTLGRLLPLFHFQFPLIFIKLISLCLWLSTE